MATICPVWIQHENRSRQLALSNIEAEEPRGAHIQALAWFLGETRQRKGELKIPHNAERSQHVFKPTPHSLDDQSPTQLPAKAVELQAGTTSPQSIVSSGQPTKVQRQYSQESEDHHSNFGGAVCGCSGEKAFAM